MNRPGSDAAPPAVTGKYVLPVRESSGGKTSAKRVVFDPAQASSARVYDWWLGGKDNLPVDREAGDRVAEIAPEVPGMVRAQRAFLGRAVRLLAESGLRQFLDIGCGLPTQDNVHQIARRVAPDTRVVYVDNDPEVLAHARALLATDERTIAMEGDLRTPDQIVEALATGHLLDLTLPIGVILVSIAHFLRPADDPARIVKTLMAAMPTGSHLVLSHIEPHPSIVAANEGYHLINGPMVLRGPAEIRPWFDGLDLLEPGLVRLPAWRPGEDEYEPYLDYDAGKVWVSGAVAVKPSERRTA